MRENQRGTPPPETKSLKPETSPRSPPRHPPPRGSKLLRAYVYPSWRGALPGLILAAAAACVVYLIAEQSGLAVRAPKFGPIFGYHVILRFPLPALAFLVLSARPIIRLLDSIYVIGRHHLYVIVGRCSLRKRIIEVPFEDMRGVRCEQALYERFLNIGTVLVWTAAVESSAVSLRRVYNPDAITRELLRRIDRARLKRPHAAPGQEQEIQHRAA